MKRSFTTQQREVLSFLSKNRMPMQLVDMSDRLGVHAPTLWARLKVLQKLGFVSVSTQGRGAVWTAAPDIKRMIQEHDESISDLREKRNMRYRQKATQMAAEQIDMEVEAFVTAPRIVRIVRASDCPKVARCAPYSVFNLGRQ